MREGAEKGEIILKIGDTKPELIAKLKVTKGGERVWSYMNPDDGPGGKRATIYRMTRITDPLTVAALLRLTAAR